MSKSGSNPLPVEADYVKTALRLCDVTVSYEPGRRALHQVNLLARHGECVVIVGPSGSGKSTLLRVVAGLVTISRETPSAGLWLGEQESSHLLPVDREVAFVTDDSSLWNERSVFENLAWQADLHQLPWGMRSFWLRWIKSSHRDEIDRRVRDVADRLGIKHFLSRRAGTLSAGERQRVVLGRALVRQPKILLLDEPLAHLDPMLRERLARELRALLRSENQTILYVTHDRDEAFLLADKLVVLEQGQVRQAGELAKLSDDPEHQFVAEFLGESPVLNLSGRIRLDHQQASFETDSFTCRVVSSYQGIANCLIFPGDIKLSLSQESVGWPATISACRRLRQSYEVELIAAGMTLVARVPLGSNPITKTQSVFVRFNRAYFFSPSTGERIDASLDSLAGSVTSGSSPFSSGAAG